MVDDLTKCQRSFFEIARKIGELATYSSSSRSAVKIGCILVYGHKIISSGYNSDKTNPLQKKYNSLRFSADTPHKLHAEMSALIPVMNNKDINFSRVKLFIYRETADHHLANSRPCKSCMKLLKDLGIKNIYYTTSDGYCHETI